MTKPTGMPEDQELAAMGAALADWFISQEISIPQSAVVMIHLLSIIIGDAARSGSDLQHGVTITNEAIEYKAARAFAIKHKMI